MRPRWSFLLIAVFIMLMLLSGVYEHEQATADKLQELVDLVHESDCDIDESLLEHFKH